MATSTAEPATTRRGYPSYSRNIAQRLLVNRETAVIAALVVVYVYSLVNVEFFDGPLTTYNLGQGVRADPDDGAADDADHHHRRDRPVGGEHARGLRGVLPACSSRSTTSPW